MRGCCARIVHMLDWSRTRYGLWCVCGVDLIHGSNHCDGGPRHHWRLVIKGDGTIPCMMLLLVAIAFLVASLGLRWRQFVNSLPPSGETVVANNIIANLSGVPDGSTRTNGISGMPLAAHNRTDEPQWAGRRSRCTGAQLNLGRQWRT